MLVGSYEQIVQMISRSSELSAEDIERKIEAKRARLSGLISKEGAAQIVASELGINFEKQKMRISELLGGMKRISLTGKIIKMNRVIEYNKNNRSGKIGSFVIADETGNMRVVLWDTNHISLVEKGEINEGDVVEISGADVRNFEIHLSGFADLKKSAKTIENVQMKNVVHPKKISEIQVNDNVLVRAFAVQIFGPTFFFVCPECSKKVSEINECITHGKVAPLRRAILNLVIDDGTGTIRSVLFSEQIGKLASEADLESTDMFMKKREELLGKELIIEALSRKNRLSEAVELIVSDVHEANIDSLIKELES